MSCLGHSARSLTYASIHDHTKVHCVISESLRKFYNSKINEDKERITVSDLLTLGALNEAEKQEHENERLAFGKIDAEIRAFILDEISEKLMSSDETGRLSRVMNLLPILEISSFVPSGRTH